MCNADRRTEFVGRLEVLFASCFLRNLCSSDILSADHFPTWRLSSQILHIDEQTYNTTIITPLSPRLRSVRVRSALLSKTKLLWQAQHVDVEESSRSASNRPDR